MNRRKWWWDNGAPGWGLLVFFVMWLVAWSAVLAYWALSA